MMYISSILSSQSNSKKGGIFLKKMKIKPIAISCKIIPINLDTILIISVIISIESKYPPNCNNRTYLEIQYGTN